MQPETQEKPRPTLKSLDSDIEFIGDAFVQMFYALDEYHNQRIGWFEVLELWHVVLQDVKKHFYPPTVDAEIEEPTPPEESDAGDLPENLAGDQPKPQGAESVDV